MNCPCCGSDSVKEEGLTVCKECFAVFSNMPDAVEMIDCNCSRHDNGKIVRTQTKGDNKP